MPSPFPGMDPYLESHWGDIHTRLALYSADQLETVLPPEFYVRVEERIYVDTPDGSRFAVPDARVVERPLRGGGSTAVASGITIADPAVIHWPDEPVTERYVEIHEAGDEGRVVTVIEFLSLSNKRPGEGQQLFLKKVRECRDAGISFVEIDLLRSGRRSTLPPEVVPLSHRTTYQALVRRGWDWDNVEVYRIPLRERLPVIPIPLREAEADAPLDLQPVLEQAYRKGRYESIDYTRDPNPPLDTDDAAWADALLREKGHR